MSIIIDELSCSIVMKKHLRLNNVSQKGEYNSIDFIIHRLKLISVLNKMIIDLLVVIFYSSKQINL
jgi:hypothetical protein